MGVCSHCQTEVQEAARFCPSCGNLIAQARPVSEDPYLGRILDRKFRIDELIGLGGMGRVYKATQLNLDKLVCVKVLRSIMMTDETLVGRFHREARAASRLNHPNSITVIDFGQAAEDGSLYLAMEFVPGKDLGGIIRAESPLPEKRIIHIMDQVLSALADAHAANIVHRDLKPENIMVTDLRGTKDFVKVLDFGIAKIQEGSAAGPGLTQVGMVCGTPEYMSPEQARGEELDARSDLYSAGVILYQMVTGRIPFDAPTAMGIVTKHLTEPPLPPSQVDGVSVSPALEAAVLKAISKDRNGRQPTALALQQELNQVLSKKVAFAQQQSLGESLFEIQRPEPVASPPAVGEDHPPVPEGQEAGRRTWKMSLGLSLLLLIGGGLAGYFFWWLPGHRPPENRGEAAAGAAAIPAPSSGSAEGPALAGTPAREEVSEAAKLHYHAGGEFLAQNKIEKAIAAFEKAIRLSPNFAGAYKVLATCHLRLGDIEQAKKNFRLYLEKAPSAEDRQDIEELIKSL